MGVRFVFIIIQNVSSIELLKILMGTKYYLCNSRFLRSENLDFHLKSGFSSTLKM